LAPSGTHIVEGHRSELNRAPNRKRATDVHQLQNADNHIAMKNEAVNFKI
jgi:hypothetical protein